MMIKKALRNLAKKDKVQQADTLAKPRNKTTYIDIDPHAPNIQKPIRQKDQPPTNIEENATYVKRSVTYVEEKVIVRKQRIVVEEPQESTRQNNTAWVVIVIFLVVLYFLFK